MSFWEYEVRARTLCLGERLKGGLFRPCDTRAIRYSAVTGALKGLFSMAELQAAGYFVQQRGYNGVEYLTYSPRDDAAGTSRLPLTVQYLTDVLGRVVIRSAEALPDAFETSMGAMKSLGFGRCRFRLIGRAEMSMVRGRLRTRLPLRRSDDFEIRKVIAPAYGYLFEPASPLTGEYVLSLFEGSWVDGPRCLVEEDHA